MRENEQAFALHLRRMLSTIIHRGPDSDGAWIDIESGIGLGHRRLSIVDLSPAGAQPMISESQRYVIAYNGEIYNHAELRAALEKKDDAPAWRGHSDTETLLAGFDVWGIEETIARSVGMFAFALWDRRERVLFLGRDRLGEKPLYYGWAGAGRSRVLLFGSEMKALRAHPALEREIDSDALHLFLQFGYIGGETTIYRGIRKVLPGCLVVVSLDCAEPVTRRYWSAAEIANPVGREISSDTDPGHVVDRLEGLLEQAVRQQMVADVPVGAFLSGGIDSSTIVALMQKCASDPVHTFSVGFDDPRFDEAQHARLVASHLGTRHTELYVRPADLLKIVPRLARVYDEPFADASQIPTILVAEFARQHVTVSLSGDGGDELFCGYDRYRRARDFWRWLRYVPRPVRGMFAGGVKSVPPPTWTALAHSAGIGSAEFGQRVHRIAGYASSASLNDMHRGLVSHWTPPPIVVGREPQWALNDGMPTPGIDGLDRMMLLDMQSYLPDDVLVKVDRASMSVSLESRAPLLDHRVVEFALRLPNEFKLRDGTQKWALREVLYRHVPRGIVDRPKKGFAVPIGEWLRDPLLPWAEALLEKTRLRSEGYLDPKPIDRMWKEHLSRKFDWSFQLWDVLMFQAWLEAEADPDLGHEAPRAEKAEHSNADLLSQVRM